MNHDRIRRIGGIVCTAYGAAVIIIGLFLINYDLSKGGFFGLTSIAAIMGVAILGGGIAALRGYKNWAYASLVGSLLILAASWKISYGRPGILFASAYGPLGLLVVLMPAVIACLSIADIVKSVTARADQR